ncbi:MAG: hypothetical protein ACPGJE_03325 [Wenzhouxiangellaceae bacterium]
MNQDNNRTLQRNAAEHVLGRLEQIIRRGRPSCLTGPAGDWIWLDPAAGLYTAHAGRDGDFSWLHTDALDIRTCPAAPSGSESARPVSELMWQVAYHFTDGELLYGCGPHDVIELHQWPNLTRLPHTREMIMLASMLFKRPASLSFTYRVLRIPQADAFTFYSAARAAGLIRTVSTLPAANSAPPVDVSDDSSSTGKGLWQRLFHRFARL